MSAREDQPRSVPAFVEPMAAKLVTELPAGDSWLYEVKLDGYRSLALKDGPRVQLRSRRNKDLLGDYPHIGQDIAHLRARSLVLDGEIVALDAQGRPAFQLLQNRARVPPDRLVYFAFDILHLDGQDLRSMPLVVRKERLAAVVEGSPAIQVSQNLPGTPKQIVTAVRRLGLEGVIAKRQTSVYEPGRRSGAWVKLKLNQEQEFVIGGYKPDEKTFQSLLVGYYADGHLRFAGRVRAGFTPHIRAQVFRELKSGETSRCPFVDLPTNRSGHWGEGVTAEDMKSFRWLHPRMVAQVSFVEWPEGGLLRHASFVGLRDDTEPSDVVRER
jgi:bifunctional non-homologous end joining protein LigD